MASAVRAMRLVALGELRATTSAAPVAPRLLPQPFPRLRSATSCPIQARRRLHWASVRRPKVCGRVRWSSGLAGETKKYTFEELQSRIASGQPVLLVDVREPAELQETGRVPGAYNLPVTSLPSHLFLPPDEFEDALGWAKPARGDEVVFYCRSGVRSKAAATLVREEWERNGVIVSEYPGSWMDWEKRGGKVEG